MTIKALYLEEQIAQTPLAREAAQYLNLRPIIIKDFEPLFKKIKEAIDPWREAKQSLVLARNKGRFIKECPGTKEYICCGYKILHIGSYCTMDCSYCILQSYFHPPILQYFVNHDDLMAELDQLLNQPGINRIGSGEFTDSMIWEGWSVLTRDLIERFASQNHSILELKTKTTSIKQLKGRHHNRKTIMSWSLNTPRIIASQERGTASLKARIKAAAKCQTWGYPLAFHFDPMVIYPGCEDEYLEVLKLLFGHISHDSVVWISLGTFRFMPGLKSIIEQRFTGSNIVYGEFIPGLDGKMRYFKPLRVKLYRSMVQWIKEMAPGVTTYLCMEDDQVWKASFGFTPQSEGGLSEMLDNAARQHCGLQA